MAQYVTYSEEVKERILELYLGGESLHAIASREGMPSYQTILRWSKDNAVFKKELIAARETRALHFEERAINAAENAIERDDVPAARLKFDAYAWAAEKADPARFGKRTNIAGDAASPVKFIVQTGVPDPGEYQRPPELAADGTVKTVISEVVNADANDPTPDPAASTPSEVAPDEIPPPEAS